MKKRIGNIEVESYPDSESIYLTIHYNDSVRESIRIHDFDDLLDLEYAVQRLRREMDLRLAKISRAKE